MNRNTSLILAAVIGGVVVGGVVWFSKPTMPPAPPASTASRAVPVQTPVALGKNVPVQATAPSQVPPWADGAGVVNGPASTGIASAISTSSRDPEKTRQRAALRARLHKLTAGGRHPSIAELNDVLGDMERVEGSPVVAGVDIGTLRKNLAAVDKLQKLSLELQTESQKPGGGDKQKIQNILAQLKQIQADMNLNAAALAPAPTAPR